jgi:hypothetical protein
MHEFQLTQLPFLCFDRVAKKEESTAADGAGAS